VLAFHIDLLAAVLQATRSDKIVLNIIVKDISQHW